LDAIAQSTQPVQGPGPGQACRNGASKVRDMRRCSVQESDRGSQALASSLLPVREGADPAKASSSATARVGEAANEGGTAWRFD
jgi:hypothetical protein